MGKTSKLRFGVAIAHILMSNGVRVEHAHTAPLKLYQLPEGTTLSSWQATHIGVALPGARFSLKKGDGLFKTLKYSPLNHWVQEDGGGESPSAPPTRFKGPWILLSVPPKQYIDEGLDEELGKEDAQLVAGLEAVISKVRARSDRAKSAMDSALSDAEKSHRRAENAERQVAELRAQLRAAEAHIVRLLTGETLESDCIAPDLTVYMDPHERIHTLESVLRDCMEAAKARNNLFEAEAIRRTLYPEKVDVKENLRQELRLSNHERKIFARNRTLDAARRKKEGRD